MATPRKPRPTFDTPKPTTPATSTWAYRTDAEPTPVGPPTTPSVLNRIVTTPIMLGVLIVLAPFAWLSGPPRPR